MHERSQFRPSRILCGKVLVEVLDHAEARGDRELLEIPCASGARTPEQLRAVNEVHSVFHSTYAGEAGEVMVVKTREVGGGLMGASVLDMEGDHDCARHLFTEPYVAAIARTNEYHGVVLNGPTTMSAGTFTLHATVETVVAAKPSATIYARVLEGNRHSHSMFDAEWFETLPGDAFFPPTEQIIRRRRPRLILPPGCWSLG
jgi:hypothetical protein